MADQTFEQLITGLKSTPLTYVEVERLRAWIAAIRDPGECIALIGRESLIARELLTVRAAADNVGVHRTTSFRWRHRFVPGAIRERPARLAGLVEADETWVLESQKGSRHLTRHARHRRGVAHRRGFGGEHDCLLVARDRIGATLDFHTGRALVRLSQLEHCLSGVFEAGAVLVTDGALVYQRFVAATGTRHEFVKLRAGIRAKGAIHLQNVNGWHSRFKGWLLHFRGVASKYLANYPEWQRLLDARQFVTPAQWLVAAAKLYMNADSLSF